MSMAFFLAYDPSTYPLNNNEWSFPVCEILHIAGFAMAISTIAMVDFNLLGLGLKRTSAAQLVKDLWPWTTVGLASILITGPLIFLSDPYMYLGNSSFRFKLTMLAIGILYNYTIHRKVALSGSTGAVAKMTGIVSLAIWISVVAGGIFIAFI
jgi:hypothetical protein